VEQASNCRVVVVLEDMVVVQAELAGLMIMILFIIAIL
jgi:hypothetical protein